MMKTKHFVNYPTMEEAIARASAMNKLAAAGNHVMNCDLYKYSAGPAFKTRSMSNVEAETMGGLYRTVKASRLIQSSNR